MKCFKCGNDFPEKEIHISHDIPKYVGGIDADGRHHLCKKCHDIYEKMVFSAMTKNLPEEIKKGMRNTARSFAKEYFKKEGENG